MTTSSADGLLVLIDVLGSRVMLDVNLTADERLLVVVLLIGFHGKNIFHGEFNKTHDKKTLIKNGIVSIGFVCPVLGDFEHGHVLSSS